MKLKITIIIIIMLIIVNINVYSEGDLQYLEEKYNLERFEPSKEDFSIYPNFDNVYEAEQFIEKIRNTFPENNSNHLIEKPTFDLFGSGSITFTEKASPITKIVCDVSYEYKYDSKLKENIYTKITDVVSRKTGFTVFNTWEQKSYIANFTNGGGLKTSLSIIIKGDHIIKIIVKGVGEVYREHGQYNFYSWGEPY